MKLKFFVLTLFIFTSSLAYSKEYLIGFGSCVDQDFPQPIWNSIESKDDGS